MKTMNVTMTDANKLSLVKRCIEKEKLGYEYVTPIKPVSSGANNYTKGYGGHNQYSGQEYTTKFQVVMRKITLKMQ